MPTLKKKENNTEEIKMIPSGGIFDEDGWRVIAVKFIPQYEVKKNSYVLLSEKKYVTWEEVVEVVNKRQELPDAWSNPLFNGDIIECFEYVMEKWQDPKWKFFLPDKIKIF